MKNIMMVFGLSVLLGFFGCNPKDNEMNNENNGTSTIERPQSKVIEDENSINSNVTPEDQGESEVDRTITQSIRKSIVDNENYSMKAKNIKVITLNGVVTLKGEVDNITERNGLEEIAKSTFGVKSVVNDLTTDTNTSNE